MKKINLGQKEIIHFVGIGGIGMSGLAQIMKNMGFKIQGSDQQRNKNTKSCSKAGIKVFIGHSKNNVKSSTILVKSSAIKNNNNEIVYAKSKGILFILEQSFSDVVSLKKYYNYRISWKQPQLPLFQNIIRPKLDPTIINGGVINSLKVTRN